MKRNADVVIVGSGVAGLYCALNLPRDKKIIVVTKADIESSDSYLAQGGISVLKDVEDFEGYFEDTMKAGHYENNKESVEVMIRSSREVINDLISIGVEFNKKDGKLQYTREGAHRVPRILYHKDVTGKEITRKLINKVRQLDNVTLIEHFTMLDILTKDNICYGILGAEEGRGIGVIEAKFTVFACGGIGGIFDNTTNYPHLTGDALAIALKQNIETEHINYIQIHPTTLYTMEPGKRFLISESVRGEGAHLYNAKMERFVDELLPRDVLSEKIKMQMQIDGRPFVWLSMKEMDPDEIMGHFPNIYEHCLEEGYDVTKECIPVVPSQHYFMGGIKVDIKSKTSMKCLYAVGEISCNGVHGKNRLASNSLLESLVFSKRAAIDIMSEYKKKVISNSRHMEDEGNQHHSICKELIDLIDYEVYENRDKLLASYKNMILAEIEKESI